MVPEINDTVAKGQPYTNVGESIMEIADHCPECGSDDIEFQCQQTTKSPAGDGRLRLNEVDTLFVLGCNYCSETIQTLTGDEAAHALTAHLRAEA
jgi:hypothetical protein